MPIKGIAMMLMISKALSCIKKEHASIISSVPNKEFVRILSNNLNGMYLWAKIICEHVTHISALSVAIAAPFCANLGIRSKFNKKFVIAPTMVEIVTILILPSG